MVIYVGKDEGEWPKGTRVRKVNSATGDAHKDGALGTIVGAMGPMPAAERAELIPELAKKGINEDVMFIYWVEWDDLPGVPIAITDFRLERVERTAATESVKWVCHVCGEERPDDKISVLSKPIMVDNQLLQSGTQNIRYCNDKPACIEGARHKILVGDKREFEIREIKLGDNPFLKGLTEREGIYAGTDPETVITVMATAGYYYDWAAYYQTPQCPASRVHQLGNKFPEAAAEQIFPDWAKRLIWRR